MHVPKRVSQDYKFHCEEEKAEKENINLIGLLSEGQQTLHNTLLPHIDHKSGILHLAKVYKEKSHMSKRNREQSLFNMRKSNQGC